jgi:hypothetical protein
MFVQIVRQLLTAAMINRLFTTTRKQLQSTARSRRCPSAGLTFSRSGFVAVSVTAVPGFGSGGDRVF